MRDSAKRPTAGTNHRLKQSGALAIAALLATAIVVATAFADKEVVDYFGASGSEGGQFSQPRDVGVNRTGAGPADAGDIYVADDNNHRVQRFDAQGNFISTWGADVAMPEGGTDYELCTVAAECKAGAASPGNGTTAGNGTLDNPQSVAVDNDTGNVFVSDRDNRRVNVYDGEGSFISSFGWDVDETEAATVYEVCPAANVCKAGVAGAGAGQVGSTGTAGTLGIAVSQPDGEAAVGKVFLADSANRRVNTYDLNGQNPASFGSSTEFGTTQPRKVAVDSRGIVYASNSEGGARIERYDTEDANGGGVGFLASILATVAGSNETQKVTFSGYSSGDTFTLTCPNAEATDPIEFTSSAFTLRSNMQSGLEAKCGPSFSLASGPLNPVVTFQGSFSETNVPTMVCSTATGSGSCSITEEKDGFPASTEALLPAGSTATATSGLAVDPDSDEGGADVDSLFVLRDPSSGNTVVQQFDEPGLTAAPTAADDEHGAGAGFTSVNGLGLNDSSGQLFVTATNDIGAGSAHRVYVLDDVLPAPVPVLEPITVKDDKTATLSATVDPQGGHVTDCRFEYSTDPTFSAGVVTVNESDCPALDPEGGAQALSEEIEGLVPNTTYHVRFEVSRTFIPSSEVVAPTQSFLTDQVPPYVTDVTAINITDTSARLAGVINPANSETSYAFEYGPTAALGSETAPLAIGGGNEEIVVSQVVKGLAKDTDYFYRLVATNEFGTTTDATQSFHTRAVPLPNPANRAYEQVSPVDKNWGDAVPGTPIELPSSTYVSSDGEGVGFASVNGFGDDPAGQVLMYQMQYASDRGSSGWRTQPLAPPACANDLTDPELFLAWASLQRYVSAKVERAVIPQREAASCALPPIDPAAPLPATNLYRANLSVDPVSYELLAPEPPAAPDGIRSTPGTFVGGDDDFSHVVYSSTGQQIPAAPAGNFEKLYEWDEGTLRLVSIDPSGTPFATSSSIETNPDDREKNDAINSVSASGERIFFHNPASGSSRDLYMREGGITTHHVSESECTSECGSSAGAGLEWASRDGGVAFFSSGEKLVDDATLSSSKLYAYRHSANPALDSNLTFVSTDDEPADGTGGFMDVLGVSDDGDTAFFTASGQLVAGGPMGGGQKIYRWSWNGGAPTLEYLATASQDEQGLYPGYERDHWERRVSQQGNALMIETSVRIVPAADADEDVDVYLWRKGEGWACVSCQVPGDASGGPSTTGKTGSTRTSLSAVEPSMARKLSSAITDDGERAFFITQDALVAGDVNGPCTFDNTVGYHPCTDIYEWHDGRLTLISTGAGSTDTSLLGVSADGEDVLFFTREKLVGWDIDKFIDIYDARIGGGFPEPPPQPALCEGEGCRDEGSEEPGIAGAGSAVFQGPANGKLRSRARNRCPANKLRRGKRCLPLRAIARKRCRRLNGKAKRRCIAKQTRRLRRAQRRRAQRRKRRQNARAADTYRRATR